MKRSTAPVWPWPDGPLLPRTEDRTAEERLAALDRVPAIDYPAAARVRSAIADVVERDLARLGWPPMLLVGTRDNGRSTLVGDLDRRTSAGLGGGRFVTMTLPASVGGTQAHAAIFSSLRRALGDHVTAARADVHEQMAMERLGSAVRYRGLRVLVIDGCDMLADLPARKRRFALDVFRIVADTGVAVLAVGNGRLASAVLRDADRVGPFERLYLPRWTVGPAYLDLLGAFEAALPLREPSGLARRELAMHLYAISDGCLGALSRTLRTAAAAAIRSGVERISLDLLDELNFQVAPTFVWSYG